MKYRISFLILILFMISSCNQSQKHELNDLQRQAISNIVKHRNLEMWSTWEQNDPDKVLSYYLDDAAHPWVNEPAIVVNNFRFINNLEDVENWFKSAAAERSSTQFKVMNDYINVLSSDYVLHIYDCEWTVYDLGAPGNNSQGQGTASTVWVSKNGEWYILHFHLSWEVL